MPIFTEAFSIFDLIGFFGTHFDLLLTQNISNEILRNNINGIIIFKFF